MKMRKTNYPNFGMITNQEEFKNYAKETNYCFRLIMTDNMCIVSGKEEGVLFDTYNRFGGDCLMTETARYELAKRKIIPESNTVYYCERKQEMICAHKIKIDEKVNMKFSIKTPFEKKVNEIDDIIMSQFCMKYAEVLDFLKDGYK